MEELTYLFGAIMEETSGAEGYCMKAHAMKMVDPVLATDLIELSKVELAHADKLMAHAERIVRQKMTEEPISGGMASQMLGWVKETSVEQGAKVKMAIDMFKK